MRADELRAMVNYIPPDNRDIRAKVIAGIESWGVLVVERETAQAISEEWAKKSPDYNEHEHEKMWTSITSGEAKRLFGLGDLCRLAQAYGYEGFVPDFGEGAELFPVVEPWPEPVTGDVLVVSLYEGIQRFIVLEPGACIAVCLWTIHSHCVDAFPYSPILHIKSPEKRCGKSVFLDLLAKFTHRPLLTSGVTGPALFRAVEKWRPTVLIDEFDSQGASEETLESIRNVLNSGFHKNGVVLRCVGENHDVKAFHTFAAKAVAGIGDLPDTAASRAIRIVLKRRLPDEKIERMRLFFGEDLQRKLVRWALDNKNALAAAKPALPDALADREQDIWEPLLAIADLCGWGKEARDAALLLCEHHDTESLTVELLADIRAVFERYDGADRLPTSLLLSALCGMAERPWARVCEGKRLHAHRLSQMLGPFVISSSTFRWVDGVGCKGYWRDHFSDAFARYLPTSQSG
jgi:hypothetical protein